MNEINLNDIALAIPIIIGVVQGVKKMFNIENKNINFLITILLCVIYMIYLLFKENIYVEYISYLIILIFGTTGIYNFLPKQNNEYNENIENSEFLELEE